MKYFTVIISVIYTLSLFLMGCSREKEIARTGESEKQSDSPYMNVSTFPYELETDGKTYFDLPELDMSGKEEYLEMLDITMRGLEIQYSRMNELEGLTLSDYPFQMIFYNQEGYLFCQVAEGGVNYSKIIRNDYTGWIEYDGIICLIDNKSDIRFRVKTPLNIKRIKMKWIPLDDMFYYNFVLTPVGFEKLNVTPYEYILNHR